jgi:superfamily I DNA/RNA helicase
MNEVAFIPSKYQQALFDFVSNPRNGSAIVQAVAGSGKTTTGVKCVGLLPPHARATYLAFNRIIAKEVSFKLVEAGLGHVRGSTFHSAGLWAYRKAGGEATVIGQKQRELLADRRQFTEDEDREYGALAVRLVGLARNAAFGITNSDESTSYMDLIEHHGLDMQLNEGSEIETLVKIAQKLLAASVAQARGQRIIDFDDMLYMPVLDNVRFFQLDVIFLDEAQDTNELQKVMVRRMLKRNGRLFAFGDRNQAIYGWRGAGVGAMDELQAAFNCTELPLLVCYRCDASIVRLAKSLVPQIEHQENRPEGQVISGTEWIEYRKTLTHIGTDAILCRNNAPLISKAYELIGAGVGCRVLGRDIGKGLVGLINKMKAKTVEDLETKLEAYCARQSARWIAKGQETKAGALRDQIDSVKAVIDGQVSVRAAELGGAAEEEVKGDLSVDDVRTAVERMFTDNDEGRGLVTLCTVHKAKGREWDRVFILVPELMPSPWARSGWQAEQERNLQYVAYTRAKNTLVIMG